MTADSRPRVQKVLRVFTNLEKSLRGKLGDARPETLCDASFAAAQ